MDRRVRSGRESEGWNESEKWGRGWRSVKSTVWTVLSAGRESASNRYRAGTRGVKLVSADRFRQFNIQIGLARHD